MTETSSQGLYPAEHRALRELHASGRQLAGHWRRLARRLGGEPAIVLARGADEADALVRELSRRAEELGVPVVPAAQMVGRRAAGLRGAGDVLLERNQALRAALLDLEHVITLLDYLAALAERRGGGELARWEAGWRERLTQLESPARAAVRALADDPGGAIEPAEPSPLGRAGHSVALAVGTLGEAIDDSPLGRAWRRRGG
jgi:hypothetical protein